MIRLKYILTPVAWVTYSNKGSKGNFILQRELLLFGIRIFVKTV